MRHSSHRDLSPSTPNSDRDQNGNLDFQEFRSCLAEFGITLPPEETRELMKEYDHDNDGHVSYDEFITQFLRKSIKRQGSAKKRRRRPRSAKI